MEFLEEDYTDSMLEYHVESKKWFGAEELVKPKQIDNLQDHKKLRNWQVNQPLFDGRGRWRKEMNPESKKIFKEKAQEYLVKFGYVEDSYW